MTRRERREQARARDPQAEPEPSGRGAGIVIGPLSLPFPKKVPDILGTFPSSLHFPEKIRYHFVMTWIVDEHGRRWIEPTSRKRRPKRTGGRFSELEVGDQLMRVEKGHRCYCVVTDLWFDPVVGQRNEWSGQMAAIRWIDSTGFEFGSKWAFSRHGLACVGLHRADIDYMALCRARVEAIVEGKVVRIGRRHS